MSKLGKSLVLILILVLASCAAGPHQLQRTVDDWDQELYVDSPWINAVLWIVPVIPLAKGLAAIGDFFIVDAYSFWIHDAWDGAGTAFDHYQVSPTDGSMQSLLINGSKFLEVK